jgi:phosphomevalonate kinase
LGRAADAPIVPLSARGLVEVAEEEEAVFLPSGAGGGDVFVRIGLGSPSRRFAEGAGAAGFERLNLAVDVLGVHQKVD